METKQNSYIGFMPSMKPRKLSPNYLNSMILIAMLISSMPMISYSLEMRSCFVHLKNKHNHFRKLASENENVNHNGV